MALNLEWRHRTERWQRALWENCYRPLGSVALSGFTSRERLTAEQALIQNFQPMPPGTPWGAKWEYGWFKAEVTLPEAAGGQRIIVHLEPGGESLVWVNGAVAGSIGWARADTTLARQAVAGTHYDLLIESYAGHGRITVGDGPVLHGVQTVPEPGPTQRIVGESTYGIWLEELYQLALDFTTLFELRDLLDPRSLRTSQVDEALMEATLIMDLELPEPEMLQTVRQARQRLAPILACKNGSTAPTLYAFGHAHIDVAWLWPLAETERKMARTAINQLALFAEYPEYRFLQSQPHLYWMLQELYPEVFERYLAALRAGNLIADGGMWVEADTNISGGESLIRQILYGRQYYREVLGVDSRILWLPDVFGYSGALPQILVGCGMQGFATQKITWAYNGGEPFPYNTFWWEGIDGTAIPAHIFTDYNSQTTPGHVMERWNFRLQPNGIHSMLFAFGWGDGGGGPTRDHLEFLRRVQDLEGLPRVKMASPAEFFADLAEHGLPKERYVGELYFQAHRGAYTSQAKTKQGNRRSEFVLREAELWATAARALKGYAFGPRSLESAWRKLLLNQFHDILPGSSIQKVYEEAEAMHAEVIAEAEQTANTAAALFTQSQEDAYTVFNSLSWPRNVLLHFEQGFTEVMVPSCGWATAHASDRVVEEPAVSAYQDKQLNTTILENELIRVTFNPRGEITSLWDKESQREFIASLGNELCLFKDAPENWDAWDIDSMAEQQPVPLDDSAELEILASGPLAARLRLRRQIHHSPLEQEIRLRRGSRRVEFATKIDWRESHKLLKVSFAANLHAREAIHEIQFGHLRRPTHRSRPYDADRFEVPNNKWSALAEENGGLAVLNDCKYGLSSRDNRLNLTLLKSPLAPDMNADKGQQTFTYAVYIWNGSLAESGVVREAYELNTPLLLLPGAGGQGSLFSLDAANIVIETVKPAEDGSLDVILRLYESKRMATRAVLTTSLVVKEALQTDMLEEGGRALPCEDGQIALAFRPFEIKTLRLKF